MLRTILFSLFSFCLIAQAQDTASISGTIRDSSGADLAGVAVTAKSLESGAKRAASTDDHGHYGFPALPLGRFEVSAAKAQFQSEVHTSIALDLGSHAVVDFVLQLGELRQQVTVSEAAPLVNTAIAQTSGLVGERAVKDLPLNGRSYDQLLTLNPGIVNYTAEKTGGIGISNSAVGNMFSVSGRRPQENLFLMDGVEYTGAAEVNMQPGGTSGQLLGVDAVREFNVVSGTFGAEYGKRPGAQVLIATQSGSNEFHGSLFEFLRNSAFDARNFFDRKSVPGFGRNQFGGSIGGPIAENRTFFFANYEDFTQHLGLSNVTFVPDNNVRNGYLPGVNGVLTHPGLAPGVSRLLDFWPVQNGPELGSGIGEAFNSPVQQIRENFGTVRADHIFSTKDTLNAIYTVDDSADHTPTANPYSLDIESLREQVASLHETHVFSPDVLNTAVFGFSRASYFYTGEPTVDQPGFVEGRPMSALVIGGSATPNTPSQITLGGSNNGSNLFITRNLFTGEDSVSIVRGIHTITAGGWFQRIQANDREALGQYGQATFSSLAAFMQGIITTFTAVPNPTPLGWRSLEGAFFAQDEMRLTQHFTLSLGFRAESTDGWNEVSGRAANFVFGSNGVLLTQPRVGGSALTKNNAMFLPEPRVGFAWDPFGHGKTVIRAGAGMYNSLQDSLSYRLDQNAPFNTSITLKNQSVSSLEVVPGAPLPSGFKVAPAGVQPDLQTPTVIAYTFKIEQEITPNTLLTAGYSGSHGYHEIVSIDSNQPLPSTLPNGGIYYPPDSPLANPALGSAWTWFSEGSSNYNALQIDLNHRFSHGFQLRGVYTWSKSLDDGDTLNASAAANAPGLAEDGRNLRLDWGPSTFDARHAAAIHASYELPFGRHLSGAAGVLIRGWSINGIETVRSGFPFTPGLSFNPSNNGNTTNPVRPSLNPAFQGSIVTGSPNEYFNRNAFIVPANGTYGDLGRNALYGPGLAELDLSLLKDTRLTESLRLQFRAEAFNLLNQANFNTPNLVVFTSATASPSPTAGVITSTATTSRQLQFALKLIW